MNAARVRIVTALTLGATLLTAERVFAGDLPARVVHAHADFDVFVTTGAHSGCSFKTYVPIALAPQVPLRFAVATAPAGDLAGWKIDADGLLSVRLNDQMGEKHFALTIDVDVLVMESVAHDDVKTTASLYRRPAGAAVKPYLRPLPGADPNDPDIAKLAATLKPKAQDLVVLARAVDALVRERVKSSASGKDAAGDALRSGNGSSLGRANLATALLLAHGVPARILGVVPATGSGSFDYLIDVNAGEQGWLRLDQLHRTAVAFPWSEREDIVVAEITADTPVAAGSRPRRWFLTGGLTAGPKGAGEWLCRESSSGACARSTAKQIVPLLITAFDSERARERKSGEALDVVASPTATASRPLTDWLATLKPAGGDKK